jgi:hypothetical protein
MGLVGHGPLIQPRFNERRLRIAGILGGEGIDRGYKVVCHRQILGEQSMPTIDVQGRTISDDGHYWWDGSAWQLIPRPAGKNFLDSLADSVEGAVKKVEDHQGGAPIVQFGSSAPAAAAPPAQAQPAAAAPAMPVSDLLAYLGALRHAGAVTDAEYDEISKRIQARA